MEDRTHRGLLPAGWVLSRPMDAFSPNEQENFLCSFLHLNKDADDLRSWIHIGGEVIIGLFLFSIIGFYFQSKTENRRFHDFQA
ncbi:hypothetical protein [Bacillus infantis]|uniref:hypothetical protein n=1 Tax=Bacillus infantis TaxID=324767 RepID=UPI003CEFC9FF